MLKDTYVLTIPSLISKPVDLCWFNVGQNFAGLSLGTLYLFPSKEARVSISWLLHTGNELLDGGGNKLLTIAYSYSRTAPSTVICISLMTWKKHENFILKNYSWMFYIVHVIETFFFDVSLEQISSTFVSFFKMEYIF